MPGIYISLQEHLMLQAIKMRFKSKIINVKQKLISAKSSINGDLLNFYSIFSKKIPKKFHEYFLCLDAYYFCLDFF